MLADVNHYRVNELQAADITLRQIVQFTLRKRVKGDYQKVRQKIVNIIGISSLASTITTTARVEKLMADWELR